MPLPELIVIATGDLPSGHHWTVKAGGTAEDFYTMIETVHPDGHRDEGGMGGPLLYPGRRLNTYVGADARGLCRVLARAHPSVGWVRLVLGSGEHLELAPISDHDFDVVLFAALLPRTSEPVSLEVLTADRKTIT